ncbi:MAG: hypothetical protein IPQ07_16210 [Myxococcales bacterium]|nr:hypothetical protein [Myxococcales bacterium]
MKSTKAQGHPTHGTSPAALVSKDERKKQLGSERAAAIFQARTAIDPRSDSIVSTVAGVSMSAELIEQVRYLSEWFTPTRKATRFPPPTLPVWIESALRAQTSPSGPPKAIVTFGDAAGIAPAKQVDLVALTERVVAFRNKVFEIVELGRTLGEDLEQTWAELTCQQTDSRGRKGAFRDPRGRGNPRDEARW